MSDSAGNAKKGTIEVAISQASETRERVTVEAQDGAEAYASILIRAVSCRRLRAGIVDAPMVRAKSGISGRRPEPLEALRQAIPIGPVHIAGRQMDCSSVQPLQSLKHRHPLDRKRRGYLRTGPAASRSAEGKGKLNNDFAVPTGSDGKVLIVSRCDGAAAIPGRHLQR